MRNTVYEPPAILSSKPQLMIRELRKCLDSQENLKDDEQQTSAQLLKFLELRSAWVSAKLVLKRLQSLQNEIATVGASESRIRLLDEEAAALKFKIERSEDDKAEQNKRLQKELLALTISCSDKQKELDSLALKLEQCEVEQCEKREQIETLQNELEAAKASVSQLEDGFAALDKASLSQSAFLASITQEVSELNEILTGQTVQTDTPLEQLPSIIAARKQETNLSTLIKQQRERNRQLRYDVMTRRKSIRVFCRIRCLFESDQPVAVTPVKDSETQVKVLKPFKTYKGVEYKDEYFTLDKVFGSKHTNEEVFFEVEPLIQGALRGHNICIFAYGQTSAGKSHTMISDDGIVQRAIKFIFDELHSTDDIEFEITGRCVEVYLDQVIDLFSGLRTSSSSRSGAILEFKTGNDVLRALAYAQIRRKTTSTKANASSSRSHFIFSIGVNIFYKTSGHSSDCMLRFVDLAGSERVFSDDVSRLQETKAINSSLSTLGTVIQALQHPGSHVPFRASKLTELLEPSLTDNSKVLMLVNIAPEKSHVNETLSSLRFAARANSTVLN